MKKIPKKSELSHLKNIKEITTVEDGHYDYYTQTLNIIRNYVFINNNE